MNTTPGPLMPPIPSHTLVIGLGYKARHGKDTTAEKLVQQFHLRGRRAKRYGFADALYAYCRVQHGMTLKDAPLLQRVGVEMRDINPLVWINALHYRILDDSPDVAIIADTRFANEADYIKQQHGFLVKVMRYTETGDLWQDPSRSATHVSETEGDRIPWDFTIENRGSLGELHWKVANVADQIIGVGPKE